jgi:hypothetical protein
MQEKHMSIKTTKTSILSCNFCGIVVEMDSEQKEWLQLTIMTKHRGKQISEHACPDCKARIENLKQKVKAA